MSVELKSIEHVDPADKKQALTHLRLIGMKLACLPNFSEAVMKDGTTRIACGKS